MMMTLAFCLSAKRPATADFTSTDLARFHFHYDAFFRSYFGCPSEALRLIDCRPVEGMTNYAAWKQARELAKTVFALEEKK